MPFFRVLIFVVAAMPFGLSALGAQPVDLPESDCLEAPYREAKSPAEEQIRALVLWLGSAVAPYPSLKAALEKGAPKICFADMLFGAEGFFEVDENRVVLRSSLSQGMLRAVAIHELRHVSQFRIGVCPSFDLSMNQYARAAMALEADASAVSLAVAWELRALGDPAVWDAIAAWKTHVDLAKVFESGIAESGDLVVATALAFGKWYESDWRREAHYLAFCSEYLDREERTHAIPKYGAVKSNYLSQICLLPDGRRYPCKEPNGHIESSATAAD